MPPTACVDVGALPLQLLLRRHPDWKRQPAAVVSEDKPLGTVVTVNRPARAAGVRVGMRYAAALSLVPDLHTGTVSPEELAAGVRLIEERLRSISPQVEWGGADWAEPGVFWMEVGGLRRHYPSAAALARTIQRRLRAVRFFAVVVLGHTRLGTFLLAQGLVALPVQGRQRHWLVVPDAAGERDAARRVPLERLPLDPAVRDLLEKLDVVTVDDFLQLPYAELLHRFGARAITRFPVAELHRAARDRLDLPLQGPAPAPQFLQRKRLTYRETDAERLRRHCEVLLDALLVQLEREECAVAELELQLLLEDGSRRRELIRPAFPTRGRHRLVELLALRLGTLDLTAGVEELALEARHTPLPAGQVELFRTNQRRDPAAGAAALASIRAEFGNATVARAVLEQAHLPEAQFHWQTVGALAPPHPSPAEPPAALLVRRVLQQPVEIPVPGWPGASSGPFLISSGWWLAPAAAARGHPGHANRAYYFIRSPNGALEWVYYDRLARRWYRQGWVE